jgi:hypothetical protein
MSRKTVDVSRVKEMVNTMLLKSTDAYGPSKDMRQGARNVLEALLHETGNYKGFRCLYPNEVPVGELPGIAVDCVDGTTMDERFPLGKVDPTRVHYF